MATATLCSMGFRGGEVIVSLNYDTTSLALVSATCTSASVTPTIRLVGPNAVTDNHSVAVPGSVVGGSVDLSVTGITLTSTAVTGKFGPTTSIALPANWSVWVRWP